MVSFFVIRMALARERFEHLTRVFHRMENMGRVNFKDSLQIVDFFHAMERAVYSASAASRFTILHTFRGSSMSQHSPQIRRAPGLAHALPSHISHVYFVFDAAFLAAAPLTPATLTPPFMPAS